MRRITGRFVLFIATAAILPLVLYGAMSVEQLRRGTQQSVSEGNQALARQIAGQVSLYLDNNVRVLVSIGTEIQGTQLEPWQRADREHAEALQEMVRGVESVESKLRDEFRREVSHGGVLEIHGGHHWIFVSHHDEVLAAVRKFLAVP